MNALPSFGLSVYTEKTPGGGEDAPPLLVFHQNATIVGALDGMGGAGALRYPLRTGQQTGARLASRLARHTLYQYLLATGTDAAFDDPGWCPGLERRLAADLTRHHALLGAPSTRLRSKLIRTLPTTLAAALIRTSALDRRVFEALVVWAGDSRVYALTPDGAHQLTRDDLTSGGDALDNLLDDSPISNSVSIDRPFRIHHNFVELPSPSVVFAATDGVFGYLPSPMHTEWLVLGTLLTSHDIVEWQSSLQEHIRSAAGDDATLALACLGAKNLTHLRSAFERRALTLARLVIEPLEAADADVAALRQSLWEQYKPEYERLMAVNDEEG